MQNRYCLDEVQVTSKLPGRNHAYDNAIASVHGSLERLGLDYIHLHLIPIGPTRASTSTSRPGGHSST